MGNGDYDATGALSFMLELSKLYKKPVFIPTGSYIVTDTIHVRNFSNNSNASLFITTITP